MARQGWLKGALLVSIMATFLFSLLCIWEIGRFETSNIVATRRVQVNHNLAPVPVVSKTSSGREAPFTEATLHVDRRLASVDYMACCGAGHRISKLAEANYLAKLLNFGLRAYFGYCEEGIVQTEVFHYLFGPQPVSSNVTIHDQYARINNDVPGFTKLKRSGSIDATCGHCSQEKVETDVKFYADLRDRFRFKNDVDNFRRKFFVNDGTTIGIHIRAGNGEGGDFVNKGRQISNTEEWLDNLTQQIREKVDTTGNVVVFVATDTPSMVSKLKARLYTVPVLSFEQARRKEGTGVSFGEQGSILNQGRECLRSWKDAFIDMMLLSHVDILIAARPSSFTQSLPMSLVYGSGKEFCEVNMSANAFQCYSDFRRWCCTGSTKFALADIQNYDYLRMPDVNAIDITDPTTRSKFKVDVRPSDCTPKPPGAKQICLPFDWSEFLIRRRKHTRLKQDRPSHSHTASRYMRKTRKRPL